MQFRNGSLKIQVSFLQIGFCIEPVVARDLRIGKAATEVDALGIFIQQIQSYRRLGKPADVYLIDQVTLVIAETSE